MIQAFASEVFMRASLAVLTACSLLGLMPEHASACGGCFSPPPPTGMPSVVDAHRMALLVSPRGSMLWDQIQYSGAPEDFVWVLPVAGMPEVELADNGFFEALASATTITMQAPPPPRTSCADPCSGYATGPLGFAFGNAAPRSAEFCGTPTCNPVMVFHEGVVGPYETATIGSDDPDALVAWLQDHGYTVSDNILPTIQYYVESGMNFVALRLSPDATVDRMQPVRVAIPGLALTIPLRMVAAGVGTTVDLELFVFAESRMEAANFPNAEVDRPAITYDWATSTFDYDARWEDALFAGDGTLENWVTEFALPADVSRLSTYVSGTGADQHSAADDMALVTSRLPQPYLTRLRTRVPPSHLQTDLTLASADGADIGTFINVTHELNRVELDCPTYCATGDGIDPGGSTVRGSGSSFRCAASGGERSSSIVIALVLAGLVVARRRR